MMTLVGTLLQLEYYIDEGISERPLVSRKEKAEVDYSLPLLSWKV
jgi:hypothetical protein